MVLSERREQILQLIINEYIQKAMPVPSEAVARHPSLGLSSATIRNEMAALEEDGYVTHPHTSAGRVPSDKGYRYYVEALMQEQELTEEQKRTIRHQFYQAARQLEAWMELSAAVVAHLVDNVALVLPPRSTHTYLQRLELVHIHDYLALLVMVLREARVREWMLSLSRPYSQDELDPIAARLNQFLVGSAAPQIKSLVMELSPLEEQVRQVVAAALQAEDATLHENPFLNGLHRLLAQPEFRQTEQLLAVLDVLDEHNLPQALPLMAIVGWEGVRVLIGQENPGNVLSSYSVVASRYGVSGGPQGAVAVLGPTRMPYGRTVPAVRYMASLLSELVAYYYM